MSPVHTRDLTTAEQDDGREDDGDNPLRAAADRMPPARGKSPSDAYYAARGYGRLSLRISSEALGKLDALATERKQSRSRVLERLIREAGK